MSLRYYLASSLDNAAVAAALAERLATEGHAVTYRWWLHGPQPHRMREVSQLEMLGVLTADVVIVLLPGGRGTHVEMGAAIAAGKSVVLVGPMDTLTERPVCFYAHPRVSHVLHDSIEVQTEALCALLAMHARDAVAA